MMFETAGVHHVALGVRDPDAMKTFYRDMLGFAVIQEESTPEPHKIMSGITRGVTPIFSVNVLSQEAGGILVELIHMISPNPRPIHLDFHYGDIGVNKISIAAADIDTVYRKLADGCVYATSPKEADIPGYGAYRFLYCWDPENNLVELFSDDKTPVDGTFGGVRRVGISVSDLDRGIRFYQEYAGLDTVYIEPHEVFSGLVDDALGYRGTSVRSCVLASSRGGGMVELFHVSEPRGRHIPLYTSWGDYGYLQTCMLCDNAPQTAADLENEGVPVILPPQRLPEDETTAFTFTRDRDNIPLEFLSFNTPE